MSTKILNVSQQHRSLGICNSIDLFVGIVFLPYAKYGIAKARDFTKPNIWEHIKSD